MPSCNENKNPLQRGGTSQEERLLDGLKAGYVNVDERDYPDWIVFANEFARFLNYFDTTNSIKGDWTPFFVNDISSVLSSIAIQNIGLYREEIKKRFDFLKDDNNREDTTGLETKLNDLFSVLLTLSKAMDEYYAKLPKNITVKNTLLNLIQTKLSPALNRLIGYYAAAAPGNLGYLTIAPFDDWRVLNKNIVDAGNIINIQGLSHNWITDSSANWNDYKNNILSNPVFSIFTSPLGADEYLSIQHAANHNLFSSIFDQYLFAYTKLINGAFAELQNTVSNWDSHQPHHALFLSFLKLFKFSQQQVNTITQRHLDFYYKEILRLQPKPAEPNHVHVLAELAKQVDSYLLVAQTPFKGGKDSSGKEVVYTLDKDTTFNKAKLALLKNVYLANAEDTIKDPLNSSIILQDNTSRLFASPVANSDDGLGAELTTSNKEWHPFVHKKYTEGSLTEIAMPKAQIGFAIASHYLYLTEGERKVYIKLVTNGNALLMGKHFECYLTTEKEWLKIDAAITISTSSTTDISHDSCIQISFTLAGDVVPIVNYNAAVHGGTYNCAVPVLKIYLTQDDMSLYEYDALKSITVTKAEVRVEVGMDSGYNQKGLKNLVLSNDFGVMDLSKPFQPFGAQPTRGNRMVIGSKEIFTKKNTAIQLNLEWKDLPSKRADISYANLGGANYPNIAVKYLDSGVWKVLQSYNELFDHLGTEGVSTTRQISLSNSLTNNTIVAYEKDYTIYNTGSTKGFIAIQLAESFGHKEHLDARTIYLIEKANKTRSPTYSEQPPEPYTPTLQSFYISYSAYQTLNIQSANQNEFDKREIQFFHIYPFGEAEQHKYINSLNNSTENIYLLPQFKHAGGTAPVPHIGELYIGIEELKAKEAVNILFQVMEGTANPLIAKPYNHIHWSFLSNNQWRDFDAQEISDDTLALLQSGIISFAIPAEATTGNTLLPAGYIWIRASIAQTNDIPQTAEAVCKLLSVNAQAAAATFQPNNNADDFLNNPLAAKTVSKLKTPDAAVKTILQPYPSFGGKPKEDESHFYVRVSERLRHKARAITIWDYEHLVLEAFPEIYKVKCLNHTSVEEVSGTSGYNEVKPGNVLIIPIPVLTNRNDANPLKPYTNQNTLTKIEEYLKKRISCFVTVKARQPQFEEVHLSFSLKLYDAYKDFTFYANRLKEEITQYLTPWAYNSSADIGFGGKIYKSSLINFIEERYYVDYITDVQMFLDDSADLEEAVASTARSILVSVPASKHRVIQIVEEDEAETEECADTVGPLRHREH